MSKLIIADMDGKEAALATDDPTLVVRTVADMGSDNRYPVSVYIHAQEPDVHGTLALDFETNTNKAGVVRMLVKTVLPARAWQVKNCCCADGAEVETVEGDSITVHTVITLPKSLASNAKGTDGTIVLKALRQVDIAIKAHLVHLAETVGYGGAAFVMPAATINDGGDYSVELSALSGSNPVNGDVLADVRLGGHNDIAIARLRRLLMETGVDDIKFEVQEPELGD